MKDSESRKLHRKALSAAYRKESKKLGAYSIRNTSNGKCFVGVSRDIDARIKRHQFELKVGAERCSRELQRDWSELGAEAFEFTILETIEPPKEDHYDPSDDLLTLEQLFCEELMPFEPNGYNKIKEF